MANRSKDSEGEPMPLTRQLPRLLAPCLFLSALHVHAQTPQSTTPSRAVTQTCRISGSVRDPLGLPVGGALVEALEASGKKLVSVSSDSTGIFCLAEPINGRVRLRSSANGFLTTSSDEVYVSSSSLAIDLTLGTPTLTQEVTVTATGVATPIAQISVPVTLLTRDQFPHANDMQEPLRYVPGVQIAQVGQPGATTGLSIRGSATNASKVLIDGTPVNDLGGAVEFAYITSAGIDRAEILREPNSALYGSDALAGVVSLTTRRGTTHLPLLELSADGGNFHSYRREAALSGTSGRFDYFTDFARQDTRNALPSAAFHNTTFAANVGVKADRRTDLRFHFRRVAATANNPNAIQLYGIPDSAASTENDLLAGAVLNHQTTENWHNQIRYSGARLNSVYTAFEATGIPVFDKQGNVLYYNGAPVTLHGANGYSVSGQAMYFQFPGCPCIYPNQSQRDFVYGQTDFRLGGKGEKASSLLVLGGFKYERERGVISSENTADRSNQSYTVELQGSAFGRLYATASAGLERNAVYGFAATPRASLAYYVARPSQERFFNGTKLHASFSKGIKEPSIYQESNSLYGQLLLAGDNTTISLDHIGPVGAERARTYEAGIDQQLGRGRARVGLTYFHNEFGNGLEYLPQSELIGTLHLPSDAVLKAGYGAYVNSLALRTQGLEAELEVRVSEHVFARGGYTLLDGLVQKSFSSQTNSGVNNTSSNFASIAIGQYGPLVGNRPFRQAPHSGFFSLGYTHSRLSAMLNGTLVGKRDDSTFLDSTLLLPNKDLDGAYQRLEFVSDLHLTSRLTAYTEIQNLLSQHYSEAFGYPALPFNFRSGLRLTLGGEPWHAK